MRLHLRSDVPLGAALSGGLDSSAVVCAMRHLEPDVPIHTFTFVAPGSPLNEERWADQVNAHVGATAHKIEVAPQELAADLDEMIRVQGEPFGSTSIYAQYRVFQAAREAGIVVTLDGQGADEMLAGYSGYPLAATRSMVERRDWGGLMSFWRNWHRWPGRSRTQAAKILAAHVVPDSLQGRARRRAGVDVLPPWLQASVMAERGVQTNALHRGASTPEGHGRRLAETLREQLQGRGLAALLRHGDRNAMRWSVESRVPFLTTDLAEYALSLPEHFLLAPNGESKSVLRGAMRGIVPDALLDRRDKIGFETPEASWLRDLAADVDGWLQAADSLSFIDADRARSGVRAMIDGQQPFDAATWRLINYCRWAQLHQVEDR